MTDFRALCAELVSEIQALRRAVADEVGCSSPEPSVIARARAALTEQPVGATRGEAVAVYTEVMAAHDCQTLGDMAEHFARAVLARWGNYQVSLTSSTQPLPEQEGKCNG